jgi:predicted  nucleic acid-binding Zn-ribbon protein
LHAQKVRRRQTVERKATFINQVATGRATDRDADDVGDQALSYAEVKALATGNPLILEKATVDAEVAKLTRLERAHRDDQHRLRRSLEAAERRTAALEERINRLTAAMAARSDTRGDRFSMTVAGTRHTKRADAGAHLIAEAVKLLEAVPTERVERREIGRLAGLEVGIEVDRRISDEITLHVPRADIEVRMRAAEVRSTDPGTLVTRLERRIQGLEARLDDARAELDAVGREADQARRRLGLDFNDRSRLEELRRRQAEITDALVPSADARADASLAAIPEAERMAARLNAVAAGTPAPARSR